MNPLTLLVVRKMADNENIPADRANQLGVLAAILPSNVGLLVGALAVRNEAAPVPALPLGGAKGQVGEQSAGDAASANRNPRTR